jgi:fucose permease
MTNEGVSRKFLTAAACSGAFVYGVVIILIGVTLGAFAERLSMPGATLGFYFFFFLNIGVFIAFFAVGPLIDRIGKKAVLVIGTFIVGVCMILAGISQSYQMICLWMFLLGAGAAGINGGGNTLVNDLYPENPSKALNLVNIFFSFGFVALPLIASWLMVNLGLTALMIVAAILCFVPTVLYGINKFPPPTMGSAFKLNEAGKAVSEPLVILLALVLFCYIGLEVSTSGWSRSFLEAEHGIGTSLALLSLAGFGIAMMIGRLPGDIYQRAVGRVGPYRPLAGGRFLRSHFPQQSRHRRDQLHPLRRHHIQLVHRYRSPRLGHPGAGHRQGGRGFRAPGRIVARLRYRGGNGRPAAIRYDSRPQVRETG